MARSQRKYDHEYKVQAVKLAKEIGGAKAAKELGIPEGTIHTWLKAVRTGQLDIGEGAHTPESAMSLAEELTMLRKRVKDQDKEIRRLKEENEFLEEASAFFRSEPSEVSKTERMKFIAIKTDDGTIKGKLAFYCRMLHVSRQGFYKYLSVKDRPWKYQTLADTMLEIHAEDVCNDTYGRVRMFQALTLKRPDGIPIPSERTVYRVMEKIGLSHRPKRNPKGITKADREARKSDDLLKRNFTSEKPLEKCVTDITEIKAKDGKLYVSAIFDCFDSAVLGLAMETTMKATLCQHTVENAFIAYPEIQGAVLHSDRGSQYTSELYRSTLRKYEIIQSMNSAGGRCHDNARCESMWARLKTELLYDRYNSENLTVSELKSLIWRYFISYWNNRRICTTNGGLPPMLKRQRYYDSLRIAA